MDKTGIIVVSLCAAALIAWFYVTQKENARVAEAQRQFMLTNKVAIVQNSVTNTSTASAPNPVSTVPAVFETNAPESLLTYTNIGKDYTNIYVFTSRGGGLKEIELLKYPETISARWKKNTNSTEAVASLNTHAPVPVLSVLGNSNFIGNGNFTLTRTANGVRAEKNLPDGLRLVKEFQVSSNYLINASVRFENVSGKPLPLPSAEIVIGTAAPMDADDRYFSFYGGALWFDGNKPQNCNVSYFNTNETTFFVFHRTVKHEYAEGTNNVVWAAAQNQYFALLAMPHEPAAQIVARPVTLPPLAEGAPSPTGIQIALAYPALTLSTNETVERQITFYAGPKEYRRLVKIGDQFHNHADDVMNWGTGYISFWGVGTFFAKILLSAMNALHDLTRLGYGLVIVLLTFLLRAVFWPLTAKSLRSMKKMQALAPELKAIQDKYKDDVQKMFQKRNELLKKNNASQFSGCLPAVIQMPVFIGFFTMIRNAIELRGAHFLWVADLSKPDTLFVIPGLTFVPFISTPQGLPVNLLPLLMVGVMIWQAHLQPPSPGMDPSQQRMMRFMPLMLLLFLYNYSAGMALYMTVSTSMSVVQSWVLNKSMKAPAAPALTPPPKRRK